MTMAEKTAAKQRGRPFRKGQSGNPAGKPAGARHKTTLAVEALMEGDAETITKKAIALAKGGDLTAIKLVLDRIAPPRKGRLLRLALPQINNGSDTANALGVVVAAVADGRITPDEGRDLSAVIDAARTTHQQADLEARVKELEATLKGRGNAAVNETN